MTLIGSPSRMTRLVPTPGTRVSETISVVVTAWQRRRFLREALASVQFPAGSPFDLVVVAGFRDDDLEREVQKRNGKWLVSQSWRLGALAAEGVRAARGSLIAFLDDDDLFHPFRLEEVRRAFEEDPDLGFFHNGQIKFCDGDLPSFPTAFSQTSRNRIPSGRRTRSDCEFVWTQGAGYNGSSTVMRRRLLETHLSELSEFRKAIAPYLFYRAWCSPVALVIDPRPLTAVRLHSDQMTPTRVQGRRERFARLASIGADLSADAERILAFVSPDVWSVPLRQMSSMGVILAAANDSRGSSRRVLGAALELLRRRKIWLPRWSLVFLAFVLVGSRRGGRAIFSWLTVRR